MHDTMVTMQGWLGTEVECRENEDAVVGSFRVVTTPRRFDRWGRSGGDAPTQWFGVTAWRTLAENCAASLRTGDPVVVHGRLTASTWLDRAGREVTAYQIEAVWIGHDLNRGTGVFTPADWGEAPVRGSEKPDSRDTAPACDTGCGEGLTAVREVRRVRAAA